MSYLTDGQVKHFNENGYVVVENCIDGESLDAMIDEYSGVLDTVINKLYEQGTLKERFEDVYFGDRFIELVKARGSAHSQHFDFSLPFQNVEPNTPFWFGPALLNLLTHNGLLDSVESLIGPEIYSNPVQHVRIKPPESIMPKDELGNPSQRGATQWHQDSGVVVSEASETEMLTVWFSLQDTDLEQGPLKVVPGSHKRKLLTHCPNYTGNGPESSGKTQIPEKLFEADKMKPLTVKRGDAILMNRYTVHGSLSNVSNRIRWSLDLRYNPIGQTTGREAFPGFIARSRQLPEREFRDGTKWKENWLATRERMSKINQGGQKDIKFGRWQEEGHLDCA